MRKQEPKIFLLHGIEQRPNYIGKTETRIFQTTDTTFTYKYKVVDAATAILQTQQSFLLLTDSLKSEHIQHTI